VEREDNAYYLVQDVASNQELGDQKQKDRPLPAFLNKGRRMSFQQIEVFVCLFFVFVCFLFCFVLFCFD